MGPAQHTLARLVTGADSAGGISDAGVTWFKHGHARQSKVQARSSPLSGVGLPSPALVVRPLS